MRPNWNNNTQIFPLQDKLANCVETLSQRVSCRTTILMTYIFLRGGCGDYKFCLKITQFNIYIYKYIYEILLLLFIFKAFLFFKKWIWTKSKYGAIILLARKYIFFSCVLCSSTVKHIGYLNNYRTFFNYGGYVGTVHHHESWGNGKLSYA